MKKIRNLILLIALIAINVTAYSQMETRISAPVKAGVNDSLVAISSNKRAKHIPVSEFKTRLGVVDSLKLLSDVNILTPLEGELISYNLSTGKWENVPDRVLGTTLINMSSSITINVDPTKIDIPTGTGVNVDNSDPDSPIVTPVAFGPFTAQTLTNIGTWTQTYLTVDNLGALQQYEFSPKFDTLRDEIFIGIAVHVNMSTVSEVKTATKANNSNLSLNLSDLSDTLGVLQVAGEEIEVLPSGVNLKIDLTSGKLYSAGSQWGADKNNANILNYAGTTAPTFFYSWQDGSGGFNTNFSSDIIPGKYDDGTGGVGTPDGVVNATEFTNQFVFFAPLTNIVVIMYGQRKYDSVMGATLGRSADFENIITSPLIVNLVHISTITVRGDATNLSNNLQANIGKEQYVDEFYDNVTGLGDGIIYNKDTRVTTTPDGINTPIELDLVGGGGVTVQLNGQSFEMPDNDIANLTNLIHGTDEIPTLNHVYIALVGDNPELIASATKPTVGAVGLFANVARYLVPSATEVNANGFYSSQILIDKFANNNQSHIRHINTILREKAGYISGVDPTFSISTLGGKDAVNMNITAGIIRQLHPHVFSAFTDGETIRVANDQTTTYDQITDLNEINTTTTGVSLETNNSYYNLVVWTSQDEDGTDRKIYANKPTGKYSSQSDAVLDIDKTAVKTFPTEFEGTGLLLARICLRYQTSGGGTLTIEQINGVDFEDLRRVSDGGGSSTIVQNEFSDAVFRVHNSTDPTKNIAFDASAIGTGITRTLTVQDASYVVAGTDIDNNFSVAQSASTAPTVGNHLTNKTYVDLSIDISAQNISFGESYFSNYRDRVLDDGLPDGSVTYFPNQGGYEYGKIKELGLEWDMSLMMIPSAVAVDSLYLVKGAPNFTAARASTATYINENGGFSTAIADTPRIDYYDGDGVLLIEPASENLVLWSSDFSNAIWVANGDITKGVESLRKNSAGTIWAHQATVNATNGVTCSFQFKIKNVDAVTSRFWLRSAITSSIGDLNWSGSELTSITNFTGTSYQIITQPNNWYHVKIIYTSGEINQRPRFYPELVNTTGEILVKEVQIEDNISTVTSFIPTTTATVTRAAETVNSAGDVNTFNSEEGTLVLRTKALSNDLTERYVSISDGTTANRAILGFTTTSNQIMARMYVGSVSQSSLIWVETDITIPHTYVFTYKFNSFFLYVDGVERFSFTGSGTVPSPDTFTEFSYDEGGGGNDYYGSIYYNYYFKTVLTEEQIQKL